MPAQHARDDRPVVFLSYAWSSEPHKMWVRQLADDLVANGVDVKFDGYELKPGHDTYVYMEQLVTNPAVKKVLCICDQLYKEKADGREGGVGTETQIITPQLYKKAEQTKFIPVIRGLDNAGKPFLPVFLSSLFFIDFSSDDAYDVKLDELLRDIYDKPRTPKPPFGPPPSFLNEDTASLSTAGMARRIEKALQEDNPAAQGLVEQYVHAFIGAMPAFRLTPEEAQRPEMDDRIWQTIHEMRPYRDDCLRVVDAISLFSRDGMIHRPMCRLFERALELTNPPPGVSFNPAWYDNYRFMRRDLFACSVAILLRRERFDIAAKWLSNGYYSSPNGESRLYKFAHFDEPMPSLDERRNKRLGLRRASVTADLIRELTPVQYFDFKFAMQVDFILYVRSVIDFASSENAPLLDRSSIWYPRTSPYFEHGTDFELFVRAQATDGLEQLMTVMGVTSKAEFLERFESGGKKLGGWFDQYGWSAFVVKTATQWPG